MMKDVPEEWKQYSSAQEQLAKTSRVDKSWGLEEKLNYLLSNERPQDVQVLERTARSCDRRERHQKRLRLIAGAGTPPAFAPNASLEAREHLRLVTASASDDELVLIRALAHGYTYSELAEASGGTVVSLRVRAMRMRRRLKIVG